MRNPNYDPNWSERLKSAKTEYERTTAFYAKYQRTEDFRDELVYDISSEAKQYGIRFELPRISDEVAIDEIWRQLEPYWKRLRAAEREWKAVAPQVRWQMNLSDDVPPSKISNDVRKHESGKGPDTAEHRPEQ